MDIALIACSLLLPEQRFFGFLIHVYLCSSAVPFYVPVPPLRPLPRPTLPEGE